MVQFTVVWYISDSFQNSYTLLSPKNRDRLQCDTQAAAWQGHYKRMNNFVHLFTQEPGTFTLHKGLQGLLSFMNQVEVG